MATVRKYKVRTLDTADFNRDPDLEGVIAEYGSIDVKGDERAFVVIDTGQRKVRVFHSTALKDAFEQGEPGDHIRIEFRGKVKIEGGHTFNRFQVQVWTEEDDGEATQETKPTF